MLVKTELIIFFFTRSVVEEIEGDLGGAHFLTEFGLCTPDTDKYVHFFLFKIVHINFNE